MTIIADYLAIADRIAAHIEITVIGQTYFPVLQEDVDKPSAFGVIVLADDSTGLTYLNLDDSLKSEDRKCLSDLKGRSPLELAHEFAEGGGWRSTVAWGALNAIGQSFLRRIDYPFDFAVDSLGSLNLESGDRIGMVGYFPPLVKQVRELAIPLTVVEMKEEFVQSGQNFNVTLDPAQLRHCNKVLCTSTTVINDTIDEILQHCKNAEQIAVIGPTAGFLPDPLFSRQVDIVGCTVVQNSEVFIRRCQKNEHWGETTRKYCINRKDYPGFDRLLQSLK